MGVNGGYERVRVFMAERRVRESHISANLLMGLSSEAGTGTVEHD